MKILYIHGSKKILTGAQQINRLIAKKIRDNGIDVRNVYPDTRLPKYSGPIKELEKILPRYKIMDQQKQLKGFSFIQGSTFLPVSFTTSNIPSICHFGSTHKGFIAAYSQAKKDFQETRTVWISLRKAGVINRLNFKPKKRSSSVAKVELYAATQAIGVIAASMKIKEELYQQGVKREKIFVVHNAIEDLWFRDALSRIGEPKLVFMGRLGDDFLNWTLKGIDHLIAIYNYFPQIAKLSIVKTSDYRLQNWMKNNIPNHKLLLNISHRQIKKKLSLLRGSIFLLTSRYEGFSLSLVEAMSQGLIPVAYPVGIVPEIIVNGKNGFIVNNIQEACARIDELLKNDQMRKIMSNEAFLTSLNFKSDILADKLINLYGQLQKNSLSMSNSMTTENISLRNRVDKFTLINSYE